MTTMTQQVQNINKKTKFKKYQVEIMILKL